MWAVSLFVYWQLWRYNKEAVKLRIAHLNSARAGTESLTIMVDDIPCLHKVGTRVAATAMAAWWFAALFLLWRAALMALSCMLQ